MQGRCDCGAVTVSIPARPEEINACPCDFCRGAGARWAYFSPGEVTVTGEVDRYRRASRRVDFCRCRTCGLLTHWIEPTGHLSFMGVNMANFDPEALRDVPVVEDP